MIYKTEAYLGDVHASYGYHTVGSNAGFISASAETEGEEDFIRYKAVNNNGKEYYFFHLRYNEEVTGRYMVIKYRHDNGTATSGVTVKLPFASSAASGQNNPITGDTSKEVNLSAGEFIADGEWHYLIVNPKETNDTFIPNEDGTYTWSYLRIRAAGWGAYDGTCYLDIAEIAFADDLEAAQLYATENVSE
jgi:hypothetical protein